MMTIHKEGRKPLAFISIIAIIFLVLAHYFVGENRVWFWLLVLLAFIPFFLVLQFFRLPPRSNRAASNQLVAPCDGKVVVIEEVEEPEFFKDKRIQVSIFMSPINVHANWTPCEGEVKYARYHKGLYLVAWHPKSSTENERTTIVIEHAQNKTVLVRQIAGAVARRIVYYVKEGMRVKRNEELGFIKFGSRVDLFLPLDTQVLVKIGDKTIGNETPVAEW